MRILLIEDEPETAAQIVRSLQAEGHTLEQAADGREGLAQATAGDWDLLIVDRMLPALDGLALVRTARAAGVTVPVLFLTTLGGIDDRVAGLNAGGDDYLVKPFALAELAARVAALGRRAGTGRETMLRVADLELDLLARTVRRAGKKVDLQPREFMLLEYLVRHAGQVVTRSMLLKDIWNFHFDPKTNIVDSHVSRLRGKVDRGHAELIQTVRGAGYRVSACKIARPAV